MSGGYLSGGYLSGGICPRIVLTAQAAVKHLPSGPQKKCNHCWKNRSNCKHSK